MDAARRYTFRRSHRLSGSRAFAGVFEARVRVSRGPLTIYSRPNDLGHARLGLSVSRRVGTAPQRNRIKRKLRESFRLLQHDLPGGYDWVVVARAHEPMAPAAYLELFSAAARALDRKWIERAIAPQG